MTGLRHSTRREACCKPMFEVSGGVCGREGGVVFGLLGGLIN